MRATMVLRVFAKGHRWGLFPSISLGWNISERKILETDKTGYLPNF